jgi:betaine-aldehyde dehydrogenase
MTVRGLQEGDSMAGTGSLRGEGEDVRRRQLIEATIESLADVGFAACTLMDIGRRAGVSPGLVAHYFGDKEGLLEATLRHMAGRISRLVSRRLAEAHSPRARVQAVIDANLAPEEFDRRTASVWLAFWGQVIHSARFRRVQKVYQSRMLSNLRHALRLMVPARDAEPLAVTIAAIIDGLWLRETLVAEGGQEGAGARAIATALVDAELAAIRDRPQARPADFLESAAADRVVGQHIGGRAVLGGGRPRFRSLNPATGETLAEIEIASPADLHAAIDAARRGQVAWAALDGAERRRILRRAADLLRGQQQEMARLEASDTGRPIRYVLEDVAAAADCFERFAALAEVRRGGVELDLGLGRSGVLRDMPAGVVAALGTPTRPLLAAALQLAPALAAGNALVLKSCGLAPLPVAHLALLLSETGLPAGVFNVLHGPEELGRNLVEHRGVDRIAPEPRWRGSATLLVLEDAELDAAVAATLDVAFRAGAAMFSGACRALIHRDVVPAYVERLLSEVGRIATGDPLDPRTEHGAMLTESHLLAALAAVDAARAGGARLLAGAVRGLPSGACLAPTILEHETGKAPWPETGHGVAVLAGFADLAEAVRLVDQAGSEGTVFVFTRDLGRGQRLAERIRAAACWVNFRGLPPVPPDAALGPGALDPYRRETRVGVEFG